MRRWLFVLIVFVQCAKEKIPTPEVVVLQAPENNNTCTTAVPVDASQSQVSFVWQPALHTDTYELVVQNNRTNSQQRFSTTFTTKSILLSSANQYSWWVVSSAEVTEVTAQSEVWSFYLEGVATEELLPFPAQLLAPENNATVDPGAVLLRWSGGHPEGAILSYQVLMGNSATSLTPLGELQAGTSTTFQAASQQEYFWRVVSYQANGDSSSSELFQFQTR